MFAQTIYMIFHPVIVNSLKLEQEPEQEPFRKQYSGIMASNNVFIVVASEVEFVYCLI